MNLSFLLHDKRKKNIFKLLLLLATALPAHLISNAQPAGMAKLSVLLLLNENGGSQNTADGAVAVFAPVFSAQVGNEDSYKFTNLDENLALNCGGTLLSIEGRPAITSADTLPLCMWQFRQHSYYLKMDGSNFAANVTAQIEDKYLNQNIQLNLAGSTSIPFAITTDSASFARDRFQIVFKAGNLLPLLFSHVSAGKKDKGVQIDWTVANENDLARYEVQSSGNGYNFKTVATVAVKEKAGENQRYIWYEIPAKSGDIYYRINAVERTGSFELSAVMKINSANEAGSLSVYPNPVIGNTLSLQLRNLDKGDYRLLIYNTQGQQVFAQPVHHSGGEATLPIQQGLQPGSYTLQLSNGITNFNKRILVQ